MAKVGRPPKYKKDFHPSDYLKRSIQGETKEMIATAWSISRDTLNQWTKDKSKPEFSDAIKAGDMARAAWFQRFGLGLASGKIKGNVAAWIWLTKNCLGWRDTIELSVDEEIEGVEF